MIRENYKRQKEMVTITVVVSNLNNSTKKFKIVINISYDI